MKLVWTANDDGRDLLDVIFTMDDERARDRKRMTTRKKSQGRGEGRSFPLLQSNISNKTQDAKLRGNFSTLVLMS